MAAEEPNPAYSLIMVQDFQNILIYEDELARSRRFLPLTYTRCLAELRSGALSGIERVKLAFPGKAIYLHTTTELQAVIAARHSLPVNEVPSGVTLLLNARDIFEKPKAERIVGDISADVASCIVSGVPLKGADYESVNGTTSLWDIVHNNSATIGVDATLMLESGWMSIDPVSIPNTFIEHPKHLMVHPTARVSAGVVFDCTSGHIIVESGAQIYPQSTIIGPAVIGAKSIVKIGAKIYGSTTIGPTSKVGGEIENSIIQGYSNKQHDGYLGHSFIGEWCNLGAGTNTSDLKNDYSNVRVTIEGEEFDTKSMFVGLMMGDHSKSGIGVQFNTGTAVGVSCNIFDAGFPPKWIPNFSWGGASGLTLYRYEKAMEVARKVMERRGVEMRGEEETMVRRLFTLRTIVEL